ncbi:DUF2306 domain-containing protein [Hyphomonas sp.]|uniref:DUF2306 domain-containing protein n=1 Tax=Hyphomonas sp. TaxID=87 RepID=UPI00391981BE
MTTASVSAALPAPRPESFVRRLLKQHPNKIALAIALMAYAIVSHMMLAGEGPVRLRFDPAPLLQSPLVLQLHVGAALTSFAIGCYLFAGVKGRTAHRTLGYLWVAAMAVTAISSFFLKTINPGGFSLIHALSAWTMVMLPMGVAAARRRDIASHRKHMTGMFVGGMAIAGLFTFLPGRLMWHLFFAV